MPAGGFGHDVPWSNEVPERTCHEHQAAAAVPDVGNRGISRDFNRLHSPVELVCAAPRCGIARQQARPTLLSIDLCGVVGVGAAVLGLAAGFVQPPVPVG